MPNADIKYRDIDEVVVGNRLLPSILEDHLKFLDSGEKGLCANLDGIDLRGVRLKNVNLARASLVAQILKWP